MCHHGIAWVSGADGLVALRDGKASLVPVVHQEFVAANDITVLYGNILNFTLHTGVLSRASLLSAASSSSLCVFACKAALSCFRFTKICVTACDLFAEQNHLWRDWAAGITKLHLQPMQVMPAISRKISRKYLHNILSDTDH